MCVFIWSTVCYGFRSHTLLLLLYFLPSACFEFILLFFLFWGRNIGYWFEIFPILWYKYSVLSVSLSLPLKLHATQCRMLYSHLHSVLCIFKMAFENSSFIHGLFRGVLFNFQVFENFPVVSLTGFIMVG